MQCGRASVHLLLVPTRQYGNAVWKIYYSFPRASVGMQCGRASVHLLVFLLIATLVRLEKNSNFDVANYVKSKG
jgi:hypothetical protein